jgi:hypothetical protein
LLKTDVGVDDFNFLLWGSGLNCYYSDSPAELAALGWNAIAPSRYDDDRVWVFDAVKACYLLGLAYDKSGSNKKAIEQYEESLVIWNNVDLGIPEAENMRERLKRLRVHG